MQIARLLSHTTRKNLDEANRMTSELSKNIKKGLNQEMFNIAFYLYHIKAKYSQFSDRQ